MEAKQRKKWIIKRPCEVFQQKYDKITHQLAQLSCTDNLLSGKVH